MKRAGLLLFGVLVGLLVIEVIPRVLPGLMPRPFHVLERIYTARAAWQAMMMGDAYLGYKLKPNLDLLFPSEQRKIAIRTVDFGLGDIGFRDIGTRPPFDVVAIGDSFTFCDDTRVEECWVHRLAAATDLSIATLGVNGYSTQAESRMLERYGRRLRPRLVLAGVFPNDFKDNVHFEEWTQSGTDDLWTWMSRRRRSALGDWLASNSITYRLLDGARRAQKQDVYDHHTGTLDFVFHVEPWWTEVLSDPAHARGWRPMAEALRAMQATAADMGATLVVLLMPLKEQVYWHLVRQHARDSLPVEVDAPVTLVREFCAETQIPTCDLTGAFRRQARRDRQLYLRISGHWNRAGNALAAKTIGRCLAARGLLAPRTAVAGR